MWIFDPTNFSPWGQVVDPSFCFYFKYIFLLEFLWHSKLLNFLTLSAAIVFNLFVICACVYYLTQITWYLMLVFGIEMCGSFLPFLVWALLSLLNIDKERCFWEKQMLADCAAYCIPDILRATNITFSCNSLCSICLYLKALTIFI